jgi:glycosyltransferase involved in cell wall biosynthesis
VRIAIDATALGSGRGGDETALRGLLVGLAEVLPPVARVRFTLYVRPGTRMLPELAARPEHFEQREIAWGSAPVRYLATLPRLLAHETPPIDLLYSITHAPVFSSTPIALQAHDLSFRHHPEFYPARTRLRLNVLVPLHARQARVIITGSQLSRHDLIQTYRLNPERVVVVPNAVQSPRALPRLSPTQETAWLASLGLRRPFVLYVGNLHPRKNVARLIEAFARAQRSEQDLAQQQLAIVGGHWWHGSAEEKAARLSPPGRITFTGRLADEDRDRLLRLADVLAYPSLFEGFGLPPLEAMAVGTPVLASNTSTMPEILGNAALLVDPLDIDAMARGLARLTADEALRATLRERGLQRVKLYGVRETGERALAAFGLALGLDLPTADSDERLESRASWTSDTQSLSIPGSSATRPRRLQALFRRRLTTDTVIPWSRGYATTDHR